MGRNKRATFCCSIPRCQWPRGLRHRSAAARLLRSWVRIPPGAWMFLGCECCVLSGRGLCDELIIRPEKSYRLWCVVVCDQETSRMRRPWPALGRSATGKKKDETVLNNNLKTKWKCPKSQLKQLNGTFTKKLRKIKYHLIIGYIFACQAPPE